MGCSNRHLKVVGFKEDRRSLYQDGCCMHSHLIQPTTDAITLSTTQIYSYKFQWRTKNNIKLLLCSNTLIVLDEKLLQDRENIRLCQRVTYQNDLSSRASPFKFWSWWGVSARHEKRSRVKGWLIKMTWVCHPPPSSTLFNFPCCKTFMAMGGLLTPK